MKLVSESTNDEGRLRLVYDLGDGVFVKVWARPLKTGFAVKGWEMSASHCNASGNALAMPDGEGFKVHPEPFQVLHHDGPGDDLGERFVAGVRVVVERCARAIANESADPAAAVRGNPSLTPSPVS